MSDKDFNPTELELVQRPPDEAPDPFQPEHYLLTQDFEAHLGVEQLLATISVRKPDGQWWFRVHPGKEWRGRFVLIELKEERETWLCHPDLATQLPTDAKLKDVFLCVNSNGVPFLWPVHVKTDRNADSPWVLIPHFAVARAETAWTRLAWNELKRSHDVFQASMDFGDPKWPDKPFFELIKLGFKDRVIDSENHEVIRKLMGR